MQLRCAFLQNAAWDHSRTMFASIGASYVRVRRLRSKEIGTIRMSVNGNIVAHHVEVRDHGERSSPGCFEVQCMLIEFAPRGYLSLFVVGYSTTMMLLSCSFTSDASTGNRSTLHL